MYGQTNIDGWRKMICFLSRQKKIEYTDKKGLNGRKEWFPGRNFCKLSIHFVVINFTTACTKGIVLSNFGSFRQPIYPLPIQRLLISTVSLSRHMIPQNVLISSISICISKFHVTCQLHIYYLSNSLIRET